MVRAPSLRNTFFMTSRIQIHPEVEHALRHQQPVVALESAVVTAGLPKELMPDLAVDFPGWETTEPVNLALVRLMQREVRQAGAVPAIIAVIEGALHIGLDDQQLVQLATANNAGKVSTATLAHAMATGATAGTTVSATLAACAMPQIIDENIPPIRIFSTGGIGGVHRNWTAHPDISADLAQLSRSPVCVVCAGAKSILDLSATLEALAALGIPVLGYCTNYFAQFYCKGTQELPVTRRVDRETDIVHICNMQWNKLRLPNGVLIANPVPPKYALDRPELEEIIERAEREAGQQGITGDARTPYLLDQVRRQTGDRSLRANLALLAANARLGASIASAWSDACRQHE